MLLLNWFQSAILGFVPQNKEELPFNIPRKNLIVGLVIIAVALFVFNNKQWFIAAAVNGSPITGGSLITGIELMSRLNRDFRTQTLDNMINEKIILGEAKKKNAIPTKAEIDAKITEIEKQFGGSESFNGLLAAQGQTRAGLAGQMKIQLAIEKMYSSEATVSAEEIDAFVKENKASLQATDSAGQRLEAEKALKQQKLSELFLAKFDELKKSANVKIF